MNTNNQDNQETKGLSKYQLQALEFCNKYGVSIKFKKLCVICIDDSKNYYANQYNVIVDRPIAGCKSQGFKFTDSIHDYNNKIEPTSYDFLACIIKSDPISFENFCAEYDYSTDSIKAKQTYRAVKNEWVKVRALFSDCLEALQEIN